MRPPYAHPSPLGVIPHFPQQDARQTFGAAVRRANPGLLNAPLLVADPHCAHAPTSMGVRNGEVLTVEPLAVFRLDADRKWASHFDPLGHGHLHSLEVVQAQAPTTRPAAPNQFALQMNLMSRQGLLRWKCGRTTANSAAASPQRDRHGGLGLAPEVLEPIGRQLGIAHSVLDILVPEPGLERPSVVARV